MYQKRGLDKLIAFLNYTFGEKLNGLETSELQRCYCFNNKGKKTKILTLSFNPEHPYTEYYSGYSSKDFINMYDYFQEVPFDMKPVAFHPTYYEIGLGQDTYIVPNEKTFISKVIKDDRTIAYITFFKGTDQVKNINWLNHDNKIYKVDEYDSRGFKSRQTFYDKNENAYLMEYLKPNGEKAITMNFANGNIQSTEIKLNLKNELYVFNSENELYRLFLKKVLNDDDKLVCEQTSLFKDVLLTEGNFKRYFTLQCHTDNYLNLRNSKVNETVQLLAENSEKVTAVITATSKQREDLISCYPSQNKVPFKIHGASLAVEQPLEHVEYKNRNKYKFISAMSLYESRHPYEMIRAFEEVIKKYPQAELKIFYREDQLDNELYRKCKEYLLRHNLQDNIQLKGYALNLDAELDSAFGYLDFDEFDIQPIGLLSAMAHGVPTITLKAPYGKITKQNKNGFLFDKDKVYDAEYVADLINDMIELSEEQWDSLSKKTYHSVKQLYPEKIEKQWNFLLKS